MWLRKKDLFNPKDKGYKNTWDISTWKTAGRFLGRGLREKNALPQ